MIKNIEINLGEPKTMDEMAEALESMANQIRNGYYSGIVGWSDISWSLEDEDEE